MRSLKRVTTVIATLMMVAALTAQARARDGARPGPGDDPMPGAPGFGPPPGMPRPPRPLGPGPEQLERLDLTDAQRDRLADLRDEEMRKVMRLDADARIAEFDLERMIETERPDARAVQEQADRVAALRGEMLKARVTALLALHDVLTPAQRAKLRRMRPARP
jgi:Spy/CpxP family protein refolding chaperone